MPVSVEEVGIQEISDFALMTESEVEVSLEETEPVLKSTGFLDDDAADAFNPSVDFTFKGKGDLPAGLALGTDGGFNHDQISGGRTLLTRVKGGEHSDRNNEWEAGGRNCPNAVDPAA